MIMVKRNLGRSKRLFLGVAVATVATGCAVTTVPLTDVERTQRMTADLARLFEDQEPVTRAVTLWEAMARAIKYNMDHRVKLMEYAVAARQADVARTDLLPHLTASAGYTNRSNDSGARSQSLLTGEESLEPSTSQERERRLADLTVAWNVLDFGVSYATAKQRQDQIRIAEERRRKVIQNIMQDVIDAFWRAYNTQHLIPKMDDLIEDTDDSIAQSRRLIAQGAQRKRDALEYQRNLMETRAQLWEMRERMALATTRLATLMNLRPGTDYTLEVPTEPMVPPPSTLSIDEMERIALADRPELREEDYRQRISQLDVRKAILRMFPGIEINAGAHYDSNKFLFNDDWSDVGLTISWNLFNVLGGRAAKRFHEEEVELADVRRLALSMAVMTQVRLGVQRYELARERYRVAAELATVNKELLAVTNTGTQTQTKFDVIRAQAAALAATVREHLSYAETQNAMARVLNSLGADPLPDEVPSHRIADLAKAIQAYWTGLVSRHFADDPGIDLNTETAVVVQSNAPNMYALSWNPGDEATLTIPASYGSASDLVGRVLHSDVEIPRAMDESIEAPEHGRSEASEYARVPGFAFMNRVVAPVVDPPLSHDEPRFRFSDALICPGPGVTAGVGGQPLQNAGALGSNTHEPDGVAAAVQPLAAIRFAKPRLFDLERPHASLVGAAIPDATVLGRRRPPFALELSY